MVIQVEKKILFAIVVYKELYKDTNSYISLLKSFDDYHSKEGLDIYIYDNTPEQDWNILDDVERQDVRIHYHHDVTNPGISKAYNKAGKFAEEHQFDAIVFLDQDTLLPKEAYAVYTNYVSENPFFEVAIPKISVNGNIISPAKYINYRSYLLPEVIENTMLSAENVSWINSGMLINTRSFIKSGGYNEEIQLDFSDHWYIGKLKKQGLKQVFILPLTLIQNLSAYTNSLSQDITRYKFFLRDLKGYRKKKNTLIIFFNVDLPRLMSLSWKHKSIKFIYIRIKKIKFIKI